MSSTAPTIWNTLNLDESPAPRHAASRLADDFAGVFGTETIERFLHSSFDQFASSSTVVKFLSLMAERFARQRLRAPARNGFSRTPPAGTSPVCDPSATRSNAAFARFWTSSPSPPPAAADEH